MFITTQVVPNCNSESINEQTLRQIKPLENQIAQPQFNAKIVYKKNVGQHIQVEHNYHNR